MKHRLFLQKSSNLFAENRLLKFSVLVLSLMQIYHYYQIEHALKHQKIIITPPVINGPFSLEGSAYSQTYYNQMAMLVMSLSLNYTPSTARSQFEHLLRYYDPNVFEEARQYYYQLAEQIELSNKLTSTFHMKPDLIINLQKNYLQVRGRLQQFVEGKQVQSEDQSFRIYFRLGPSGEFLITSLKEMKKNG